VRFASADNANFQKIATIVALAILGGSMAASAVPSAAAQSGSTTSSATPLVGTPDRCDKLKDLLNGRWPDSTTRIVASSWQPAGLQVKTMMGSLGPLPEHCELTAVMHERVGSDGQHYAIRFHLRLPGQWNGRFLFEGGGGTEGDLGLAVGFIGMGVPPAIAQGYAVVAQDAGHDNATNSVAERGGAVAFGFDPQARADYGGASLNPVAQAAKAAIGLYYDHAPSRSYFVGCSKGGQEGMVFAQRYPDVFDGIIAGAPGFSLPRAAIAEAWDTQAFNGLVEHEAANSADARPLSASFSDAQFSVFREAILAACDADDGVRDGITANFGACSWPRVEKELKHKPCSATVGASCLSEAQLKVLARVYGGPRDSAGKPLYSDWPIDAGAGSPGWRAWKIGAANGSAPSINVAMGAPALAEIFTTPPTAVHADPQAALNYALAFSFDRDAAKIYATEGPFHSSAWTDIAARSPHLEAFRAHGGKMIVPHGASDPVFSLNDTLTWYREVDQLERGKASNFVRVFPVPGMAHCAGGPATDQFSAFDALIDWVEKGAAPDRILAKAGPGSPWPGRTRPLCPYPKYARYSGSGSIEDAQNFSCK
jgi:Tannase and feruloyl esterase